MADSLTFECDPKDVGRIIGTKGVNIRALEAGSGCRIRTPNRDSDDKYIRITGGTAAQRQRCKDAIDGVLMGEDPINVFAEMDGGKVLKNMDPTTINFIGAKKMEFENKFQVKLVLEARSVIIWAMAATEAPEEIVRMAKDGIQDEIDDLQTSDEKENAIY